MESMAARAESAGGQGRSKDERYAEFDALSEAARKWYDSGSLRGSRCKKSGCIHTLTHLKFQSCIRRALLVFLTVRSDAL